MPAEFTNVNILRLEGWFPVE